MRSGLYCAITAALVFAGCSGSSDDDLAGAGALTGGASVLGFSDGMSVTSQQGSPLDLSGDWNWTSVETVRMPPFVATMGGITPEGENTHARCESAGTMVLAQTGASFSGSGLKTFNRCMTQGGQSFQQFDVVRVVADGRIRGASAHFSFQSPVVGPCPHTAAIKSDQGLARAMSGTGHCVVPGHPQSESPIALDPPPGGTTVTVSWEATRP